MKLTRFVFLSVGLIGALLCLAAVWTTAWATAAPAAATGGPAAGAPLATLSATPPPACGPYWRLVSSPNPGSYNITYGVAAVAANDVWAVDFSYNGTLAQTLIEHWDGSSWTIVPSPNVGTGSNFLPGVAAVSSTDVWAVGSSSTGSAYQTLTEHWNGSSWSVVPSPNQGTASNALARLAVVAANDVWAV